MQENWIITDTKIISFQNANFGYQVFWIFFFFKWGSNLAIDICNKIGIVDFTI